MGVRWMLGLLLLACASQVKAECVHNTVCENPRDEIFHTESYFSPLGIDETEQLWWKIIPANGNILLAFKNFFSLDTDFVNVIITKNDESVELRSFSGILENFELIETNVKHVLLNVTKGPQTIITFTLKFYGDCRIATENPISNNGITAKEQKCTIIVPRVNGDYNRIYLTLRNIKLENNVNLKVQDVHTSEILANVTGYEYYQVLAAESTANTGGVNSFFLLLDFVCEDVSCNYDANQYLVSFYALSQTDVACIERQKLCLKYSHSLPIGSCDVTCQAMAMMMEREYTIEILPLYEEPENTTMIAAVNYRKRHCPLHPRLCRCDNKNDEADREYCMQSTKCFKLIDRGCTWRCILIKIYVCPKIKRLEVTMF